MMKTFQRIALSTLAAAALAGGLSACAPLVIGGAAVGTMVAIDRRTPTRSPARRSNRSCARWRTWAA